jgi:hypothetical protein
MKIDDNFTELTLEEMKNSNAGTVSEVTGKILFAIGWGLAEIAANQRFCFYMF